MLYNCKRLLYTATPTKALVVLMDKNKELFHLEINHDESLADRVKDMILPMILRLEREEEVKCEQEPSIDLEDGLVDPPTQPIVIS